MAVFAGMHAVVQIVSYRLLEGIPFGKIMFFIAWMTGDTVEALCFMDIPFRIPLTACPSSIGCGMAEPTTLIRRPPYDLKMKILKISGVFLGVIHCHLGHP
jgi:hypothetical protein